MVEDPTSTLTLNLFPPKTAILAVPIIIILDGVSTSGRYLGFSIMLFIFSKSTVSLIMLPKVLSFYGIYGGDTVKRGARTGQVKVSGVPSSGDPRTDALRQNISSNHESRVSQD